jgi:hypothetical protein
MIQKPGHLSSDEELEVKRGFAIVFSACMSVLILGSLQVLTARTKMDPFAGGNSNPDVKWCWQPESWQEDYWTGPNRWHDCSMNSEVAYTRFAGWNGLNSWGNTEYERGRDPWRTYGLPSYAVPLTLAQQVTVTSRIVEAKVDTVVGVASAYVDLWINFSEPVGEKGLTWAEFIVYLKTEKGVSYPFQEPSSYSNKVCSDGDLMWYMIGYRCPEVELTWSTRTININELTNRLAQVYRVDISKGTMSCITFGVEAAQGEMAVQWNYLNYEYNL